MELQQRSYSCGPAALRAALYVLGKSISEHMIRKWAGTTPDDGTDEQGLMRTLDHYKFKHRELTSTSVREATQWLRKQLMSGRPVILCFDGWSHWVAAVGIFGKKVMVFDPQRKTRGRKRYSGLRFYSVSELADRWSCLDTDDITYYYGISIKE